ncbi:Sulfate transporter, CysZ-type [Cardiobacterium hominis]|uniref:Sulfate transporter, CysZ-type n=1 Tax=Cardiobacterium hominis TaxID=2718 RepID=A0A1C3H4Q5_9GAMM|nr:sulfate transporter CysZ [Cardiobacterium hominis]SAM65504.1 Sulfate transporter, CysZ-type [Cardiobacterium hominis]
MNALACLAEAFAWLIRPGIRRFILLPLAVNITLFAAGSYAAFHYGDALVASLLPGWLAWLHWLLYPLLAVALLILTYYSFSLVANLIAAPFNSLLAAAVEKAERGEPAPADTPLWREIAASFAQELHKLLYFLALALPTLILALILPPLAPFLWFAYTAWCAALQYLDYPMANNAIRFREQRARLRQKRTDTLAYGGAVSLLTTVPVLNLIAMPVAVIAATLYWCRHLREP